ARARRPHEAHRGNGTLRRRAAYSRRPRAAAAARVVAGPAPREAAAEALALLPLRLAALRGSALLRRLLRRLHADARHGLPGPGIGDAEPAAEVLEHVAHLVEDPDHLRARVGEVLERLPLADDAERLVARLHEPPALEAFETFPPSPVQVDELLLEAGPH